MIKTTPQDSQDRYFALVEGLRDIVFSLATDGRITSLSCAFQKITGWRRTEWIGRHFREIVHPDDAGLAHKQFMIHLLGEETDIFELRILKVDGGYATLEFNSVSQFKDDLVVAEVIGIGRDVTKRKQEEHRYRHLVNCMNGGVMIVNDGDVIQYVNRQLCEMLGYEENELIGKIGYELFLDPEEQAVIKAANKRRVLGISERYEIHVKMKSGEKIWVEIAGSPITDEQGTIIGSIGIHTNITEKKKSEARIRELASLLEIIPDGVMVTNMDGQIMYWNKGAQDIFKWTQEETLLRKISELFGLDASYFQEVIQNVLKKGLWNGECNLKDKAGRSYTCFCRVSTMKDVCGMPASFLFVTTDITEKKKSDEELSQHQRMESLGRLAGSITHDLNNIFTPIIISMDMLKQEVRNARAVETIDKIGTYIHKGTKLVRRILSFSNGKVNTFEPEVLKIHQVIHDVLSLIDDSIPDSVACDFLVDDKGLEVWGDSNQLFQVFMNLLVNARDAMPHGGMMKVRLDKTIIQDQTWVCITVDDTGMGIEPAILGKIFEPFFTTKEKGTGIGLATVHTIIKHHGGFIQVESQVGQGSSFRIYLPLHSSRAIGLSAEVPITERPLLLVIDDEEEICHLTKNMLELEDYVIVTAKDGREGLEIFTNRHQRIRAVITDVSMPRMDGIDFIAAARKVDPKCKIIIASANGLNAHQSRLNKINANIQGFLLKPFMREELVDAVTNVLGQGTSQETENMGKLI